MGEAPRLANLEHASIAALPRLVRERGCGLLMKKELSALERLTDHAEHPYVAILGGETVTDSLALLESLSRRCDCLCLGGTIANTLLAAGGAGLHPLAIDRQFLAEGRTLLERLRKQGLEILLPTDLRVAPDPGSSEVDVVAADRAAEGQLALDVGPDTVRAFAARVAKAKTVLWCGILGRGGEAGPCPSTMAMARALADCGGLTVVCGSDSARAVRDAGRTVADAIDLVSAGGEASLRMLEGRKLPGVEALRTALR